MRINDKVFSSLKDELFKVMKEMVGKEEPPVKVKVEERILMKILWAAATSAEYVHLLRLSQYQVCRWCLARGSSVETWDSRGL